MKNLLLLLLLANILYFVWGFFVGDSSEPGVAIVDEAELGPPLDVTANSATEAKKRFSPGSSVCVNTATISKPWRRSASSV